LGFCAPTAHEVAGSDLRRACLARPLDQNAQASGRKTVPRTRTGSPGGAAVSREMSRPPRRSIPCSARGWPVRTPPRSARGETRHRPGQGEEGETPGGLKIPGEDRLPSCGVTPADRSTDFRYELKPLEACSKPAVSSHATSSYYCSLSGGWNSKARGDAENGASSGPRNAKRCSGDITGRAMVDSKRQEGQGTSRDAPAIGRETL
jgi:hypothetical protein